VTPQPLTRSADVFSKSLALALGSCVGVLAGWIWGSAESALLGIATLRANPLHRSSNPQAHAPDTFINQPDQQPVAALQRLSSAEAESAGIADAAVSERSKTEQSAGCPEGMKLVAGDYCAVVIHRCAEPYTDGSGRCRRFAAGAVCQAPVWRLEFCIDEFEYPNQRQVKPQVMVTFAEAMRLCEALGKRLCSGREWTLACEGPDRFPYPTGNVRDPTACNIDLAHRFPDADALHHPATAARELARLDQRTPSGSLPRCVSPYGAYDMMGNVDEWVVPDGTEEAAGYGAKTALKGGYFGPVRSRCRPSTASHAPTFKFYQVGFRCCASAKPGLVRSSD
jgi:hypothetical protein